MKNPPSKRPWMKNPFRRRTFPVFTGVLGEAAGRKRFSSREMADRLNPSRPRLSPKREKQWYYDTVDGADSGIAFVKANHNALANGTFSLSRRNIFRASKYPSAPKAIGLGMLYALALFTVGKIGAEFFSPSSPMNLIYQAVAYSSGNIGHFIVMSNLNKPGRKELLHLSKIFQMQLHVAPKKGTLSAEQVLDNKRLLRDLYYSLLRIRKICYSKYPDFKQKIAAERDYEYERWLRETEMDKEALADNPYSTKRVPKK